MKKYVVAIASLYDNINKIHVVNANNSIQAICDATGDSIEEFEGLTIEDIVQCYLEGKVLISEPIEI